MKIKISKNGNNYLTTWIDENGNEENFSYIKLIDSLAKDIRIDLEYDDVTPEDESAINDLFNEIVRKVADINDEIKITN